MAMLAVSKLTFLTLGLFPASAPVEQLCSAGSLVCTPRRHRFTDKCFEQQL